MAEPEVTLVPLSRVAFLWADGSRFVHNGKGRRRGKLPTRGEAAMHLKRAVGVLGLCLALAGHSSSLNAQARCGIDRWPVKVWSDKDASKVDTIPVATTVQLLASLPIPEDVYPDDRRLAPHELRVYRIRAVVERIVTEDDGDWHLVLSHPSVPGARLIAEIPSPQCAATPVLAGQYAAARDSLRRVPRRGTATLVGIGFWDFIHTQRGGARNGFELHPVLLVVPDRASH